MATVNFNMLGQSKVYPHVVDGDGYYRVTVDFLVTIDDLSRDSGLPFVVREWVSVAQHDASKLVVFFVAVCKMESQTQLPTFTLAIYVGVLAGLVVFAVAFTMLRVYAYRHRLSTDTIRASYDANPELDTNNNALIATTLSVLGSPLPDFPDDPQSTSKTSILVSFGSSRWGQFKCFVVGIRNRGLSVWSSLRQRLVFRRITKTTASKLNNRMSQVEVEIATPCNCHLKSPVTPNPTSQHACQHSSKCQLSLFNSPMSNDVGMI